MEIFISWSGEQSKAIAESLRNWLPKVIQNLKPWISVSDIEKGTRWLKDISERLEKTNFGIFCLTQENLNAPWLIFEAGALSKTIDSSRVCPILYNFESTLLVGPLSQFQATKLRKEDMYKLLQDMNKCLGDKALSESQLEESFIVWWPKLEESINDISSIRSSVAQERSDRELLEEILGTVRNISRQSDLYEETSKVLIRLTPREEKIIRMKFGLGEEKIFTTKEIAKYFEMDEEKIEELEDKALRKLRDPAFYKIYSFLMSQGLEKDT
ncbi:MAG: TIR domain-containing protein [Desulfuromonadales bacterium]|nr:TIR domain-containing protein [Desulfuromonadales bacterium]